MSKLHNQGSLWSFDYESYDTCELYLWGKMTESAFRRKCEHASELLGLIHSNVYSPMCTQACGVLLYFVTYIDDHSLFRKMRNNLVKVSWYFD